MNNPSNKNSGRYNRVFVFGLIAIAAISRLLPHPPNVTPIGAIALFGGSKLRQRILSFFVPFAALLVTDFFLGFHVIMPFVYISFGLTVLMGWRLQSGKNSASRVGAYSVASTSLFFVLTNLGVWITSSWYPHTAAGLAECYLAAIPFYGTMLVGDLFYVTVLFGLAHYFMTPGLESKTLTVENTI